MEYAARGMLVSAADAIRDQLTGLAPKQRLHCEVKQAWGMSELSPIGTMNSDFNAKTGNTHGIKFKINPPNLLCQGFCTGSLLRDAQS